MSPLRHRRSAAWLLEVTKATTALRRLTLDDGITSSDRPHEHSPTKRGLTEGRSLLPDGIGPHTATHEAPDSVMSTSRFIERCRQSCRDTHRDDHRQPSVIPVLQSPIHLANPHHSRSVPPPEPQTAMQSLLHRSLNYETAFIPRRRPSSLDALPRLVLERFRPYVAICLSFLLGFCASFATTLF